MTETIATTFHRAVCSRCGNSADLDGAEFQSTPQQAVEIVLTCDEAGFDRIDGKLVCLDCQGEKDGD